MSQDGRVDVLVPSAQQDLCLMVDSVDSATRSRVMRAVRGSGTGLELRAQDWASVSGYKFRANAPDLPGRPDLVFDQQRVAVFVHGCFWHGHGCRSIPKSNRAYWVAKLITNKRRDKRAARALRHQGWSALTIWGCTIDSGLERVGRRLGRSASAPR